MIIDGQFNNNAGTHNNWGPRAMIGGPLTITGPPFTINGGLIIRVHLH